MSSFTDDRALRDETVDRLTLTVLGTSSPFPLPAQPCSGYLLRTAEATVWVDAGSGTMAEIQRYVPLEEIDGIWISHLHPDHCSDLLAVYQWRNNAATPMAPLPVYGPPDWLRHIEGFLPSPRPGLLRSLFEVHDLDDDRAIIIGDLQVTSRLVTHSVPTFGLRADHASGSLAYSGDSGPCQALRQLAQDADLLLCESGTRQRPPGQPAYHCTPEEAGDIATAARAGQLVLTHLASGLSETDAVDRARTAYTGPITIAQSGSQIAL
jgi:ribonuclease BN (tRNA processing enzyme)